MCSVYTLDIMNLNPTRIMCKFVSFRKWPHNFDVFVKDEENNEKHTNGLLAHD